MRAAALPATTRDHADRSLRPQSAGGILWILLAVSSRFFGTGVCPLSRSLAISATLLAMPSFNNLTFQAELSQPGLLTSDLQPVHECRKKRRVRHGSAATNRPGWDSGIVSFPVLPVGVVRPARFNRE